MKETIHTLPINDTKPHAEEGLICECNPKVEVINGNFLVVHNAFDGREWKELADKRNYK